MISENNSKNSFQPEQILPTLIKKTIKELNKTNKRIDEIGEIKKEQEEEWRIQNLIYEND